MANELIRQFEPILYFHKDESFFPSDAKRYLEQCALWKAEQPFDDQTSWGGIGTPFPRQPLIQAGKIAVAKNEVRAPEAGQPGDTYLGTKQGVEFPFLSGANEERFLDLAGWEGTGGIPSHEVTQTSKNARAHLSILAQLYNHPTASNPALKASRFWYHAEAFDAERLRVLVTNQTFTNLDLDNFLFSSSSKFKHPYVICYYLFFPGHVEGLQGCESTATGPGFGSFAGEWVCVALMLDRVSASKTYQAKYIGLASRNASGALQVDPENRVGMTIHDWNTVKIFPPAPNHLRLFVARGTHSLYLDPGQKDLEPPDLADPSTANCGASEKLAGTVTELAGGISPSHAPILLAKMFGGMAALGWLGPAAAAGAIAGIIWSLLESIPEPAHTSESIAIQEPPPSPSEPQKDFPPEDGDFGMIIHPPNFTPPDAGSTNHASWPSTDSILIDNRRYSIIVDRTNANEQDRQVWLPGSEGHKGYEGRWGLRVSGDPFDRRAGMRFPEFVEMFLVGLAKFLSK